MRIAASVILFNPQKNILLNTLTYLSEVELLLIFDNSPDDRARKYFQDEPKCRYYWDKENKGISKRLNQALEISYSEKVDFLLTMDQDSSFKQGDFKKYMNLIENISSTEIGMFGIRHNKEIDKINRVTENKVLITSGSVINIEASIKIGFFDERLFIDHVDTDYCIRCFKRGFKTIRFNEIKLEHNEGEIVNTRTFYLKKEKRMVHSPKRIYYKTRNYLLLSRKHKDFKKIIPPITLLNTIKNNLLYQHNRLLTIFYALKGIIDSYKF